MPGRYGHLPTAQKYPNRRNIAKSGGMVVGVDRYKREGLYLVIDLHLFSMVVIEVAFAPVTFYFIERVLIGGTKRV